MKRATVVLLSGGLSAGTLFLVYAIEHLPYSRARDLVSDALLLPGALLASIFYPHGVHDDGAAVWGWTTVVGNIVFYFSLWMLAVVLFARRRRPRD